MEGKIRILFYNEDGAGVNYFRTLTPAMELERNHSDEFYVEINPKLDFNDPNLIDYLKTFHIIHYHRQFLNDTRKMYNLATELRKSGTILIDDIDDYWELHKDHPYYTVNKEKKLYVPIIENLKIADYVTTTTDLFANEIRKVTGRDNVEVFYNSVNPIWMKQFQNNWKPDPDGRVRITYMAGSCYDDKTEIFTENGWKLFKDLEASEKVATLNSVNNQLEFQQPSEYINEPYSGDMYYGKNSLIDFAVTPNHNMYVQKSKHLNRKKPFKFELNKMESFENYDLTFKKNCDWIGDDEEYIIIPEHISTAQHTEKCREIKIKMNDWLKFYGFWMGDGWTTNGDSKQVGVCGYKQVGIDTMKEIKEIFDGYNISSTYNGDNVLRFFNRPLYNYLHQFGDAIEKYIPKHILNLPKEKLEIFLEYYMRADGHIRKNGKKTAFTSSKFLANNLNEIALKLGISATMTNRGFRNGDKYIKGRLINQRYDAYDVNFYLNSNKNNLTPTLPAKNIIKGTYDGNIYCVTVPNHILYVRRNGKSYWCGNSHRGDVQQLETVMNVISSDCDLKDKFKIIVAGWDADGSTTDVMFNEEFGDELKKRGLWTQEVLKTINNSKGNVDMMNNKIPDTLKEKYRGNVFSEKQRDIKSEESVYLLYENILTNNHKMITNPDYLQWLGNYERDIKYDDEGNFARRWTQKANTYAQVLDETDIVIAPLADNSFNRMKSNLKQVECWTRKLPIVCSDVPPYNVHGKHMENCILIPSEKNAHKYWKKHLKRLILDADLRKKLGEQLYEDFSEDYNLVNVTKKRADFYRAAVAKTLEIK